MPSTTEAFEMSTISSQIANLSPEQLAKLAYELKASKASKAQEIPRRVPGNRCPLSFAQQRLWFIAQLEPDNPSYNCMEALRMTGKLNVPLLHQTFNEVVRRHEALRTTFEIVAGEPVQIVSSEIKLSPSLIDLQALPESGRERQVSKLSSAELRRPFDLTRGPLLRVVVLRVSEQEHAILFTTHHIISDGWSLDVLVREIIDLYLAFAEGRPSPLAELPFQYADFAIWQRQRLTGPVLEGHLDYWRRHLASASQVLALPTDRLRPAVLTRRGSYETLTLSPELSGSLRALGRRERVTLFMTMLAAFDVLLSRYSGQTDFLIGTDIANRNQGTTESLIGFFVNQLVLRVDLAGDPTFNELLERVKEVTLNGYAHQEAPFEKVVDMLNPERNLSHAPLFQVKLVLQNASTDNLELPDIVIGGVEAESPIAKFDLTLVICEGDRISAEMEYSTDLFESSTISRMLTQFERLLSSAVTDPEEHISQLELLSSAERQQLLIERNDTHVTYPHTRCIQQLFEEQVALSPDAPALTFQAQHLSYAELNTRANRLAHYLRQLGVKAETPVSVCLNRSIDMVVALIAILKAGGVYIPLDPQYPTERLAFILEDVSPPIILTHSSLVDDVPSTWAQTLCLDTESELWAALPTTDPADIVISSDNLAYVMYTSGSTGNPKGVAVPHRAVVRLVKQSAYVDFGPREVFLQLAPVTFDASTLEVWGALLNGGRLVLMPRGTPSLAELRTVLKTESVTVLWLTAGLFHLMVEHELEALAGVTQVVAGGDVLSAEHVRRLLRAKGRSGAVVNGYGPTETTTFACCHRMSGETEFEHGVPIGSPIGNTQVYVLGQEMELVGQGMLGELYIGGDGLARGYYNRPGLVADRFVPHPFSKAGGERLYRTGDYVRWRAEGLMEFVGRVDAQVKIRGYRVEPGEVEAVLGRHSSVADCAVVARQESDGEKHLVAYVVTKANGHSESGFELREYLRERLPEFMIPSAIVAIESLPLIANGKVDRRELAAREVHVGGERPYLPPRTTTEEMLCDVWQEVLHAERVGIDDNFFDLGGDSILTIQVIVKARAVGLELNVQQLFQYQTVHELAQELGRSNESSTTVGETGPFSLISEPDRMRLPAGVVDAYPLTALQAGMLFHSELAPDAGHYHDIFSFHLRMPFDSEALHATLQQLIDLHPVLRTSFNLSDFSEPIQLVHEKVTVPLRIGDLRSLSQTEQEEFVASWIAAEKTHRFDWRNTPLIRFQIDRRDEESFQFSFSFHHAILDGWSVATMLTELFKAYAPRMQREDRASEAPPGAAFRDFVAAERAILNSEAAQHYWTTMLIDATQSRLPRLGQTAGPSRVAVHQVDISSELSFELKELARTAGVPLKSVLLAAHLRVLSLLTGGNDVLTGIVSHGRPETEDAERVLGLFLNTLPFRRRLAGGTWLQLAQETFEAERELLPFRRYPMARMQQDLGNDTPLFEIIFSFVHFHVYEELQNLSGIEVLGFDGVADTNFTLSVNFSLELAGSQIRLELNYNAAELSEPQIEGVGRNYLTILEIMTRRPLDRYEHQCLLSQEEQRKILYDWNDSARPELYSAGYLNLFEAQVARSPQAVAAVLDEEEVSYEELNRRANQLAHYLQTMGVGPDVPVGVLLERSLETIVVLLAIFKAGGAYVPLDREYPDERLRFMARDAGIELLVTEEKLSSRLADTVVKSIRVDADWPEIANENQDNPQLLASASNLAYVIYTSGSSGTPKGAMVTQGGLVNCLRWMQQRYRLTEQDAFLLRTSLNFDPSVWEVFWPLMVGGRVVVAPAAGMMESSALLSYIAEQSVTCAYFVPSLLGALVRDPRLSEVSSLRYVISGGEKLPLGVMREFHELSRAELHHSYGPTETSIAATEWTCVVGAETVLMGRPIGNTQVYVLDGHMEPLPVGVAGELYIGGAGVGRGYAGQAELTAEKFVPDRFSGQVGARLYRTGDMVKYDHEGNLEFLGRIDEQMKLRGYRIELGEIEAVLRGHQQVSEAVVMLREVDGDKRLVAYVVGDAQASELREYLRERLPDYMVPSFFVDLDELPLLPNGKINRHALSSSESIPAQEAEYEAPRTQTEELLAGLWARLLRVSEVGVNDNFFELGGHSLLAIQLISLIRDAFGLELPLSELFEHPTVFDLAQSVEREMRVNEGLLVPPLLPAARENALPLSFAQQRLWFLDQLMPDSNAYTLAQAIRLRGALNPASLEQSINDVIRRHESVRTTFDTIDGDPVQVIAPFKYVSLPLVDLSWLSNQVRESEALRIASAEAGRPFDLQRGPLLRAVLLRMDHDDQVLLFTMHHIVSDGWSMGVLVNEVTSLYNASNNGAPSPLSDLTIQYADFAVWQRQWLTGDALARQLNYWSARLRDAPPLLALPTDYVRPKVQLTEGATYESLLSAELTTDLKSLSQQSGVTLFMTMLAGFHALLHRYAQQATILTGTPVANRTRAEMEPLIGFFVNTLVLRSDFADDPTFLTHLARLRLHALAAYAHQDLPFELLVDELQLPRDLSYNPLFQVMFTWDEALVTELQAPGLEASALAVENPNSQFDLTLLVGAAPGGQLHCTMQYNTALFAEATIRRMLSHYEELLRSVVREPQQRVSRLSLLSNGERQQLLREWNDTAVEYEAGVTLSQLFERQVQRDGAAVALVSGEQQISYGELNERANRVARHLRELGVGAEGRVGLLLERGIEMVVGLLGIIKAGAAYVPLDASYPRARLEYMLRDAAVSVVLTERRWQRLASEVAEAAGSVQTVLSMDDAWAEGSKLGSGANLRVTVDSENLAYIIYTSGSTGQPKGVMNSHHGICNRLLWMQDAYQLTVNDRILQKTPFSFDVSVWEVFWPLLTGARLVMAEPGGHQSPAYLRRIIEQEQITVMHFVPAMLQVFLEEPGLERCTSLRKVMCSGEALSFELQQRFFARLGAELHNLYGPTEAAVDVTYWACEQVSGRNVVPIGKPIANTQIYILDRNYEPVPVGVAGELHIAGVGLARGYHRQPELTAEKFVANPFSREPGARLYKTGDLARYLADGSLEFLGRIDHQVKLRGFRIELGEIEAMLRQHASVREVVVVAQEIARGEKRLVAYVQLREGEQLGASELRVYLKERLPEYMVPSSFVEVAEFALTPNGKINRQALPAAESSTSKEAEYEAPRTATEELLTGLWANVLRVKQVGVNDNFFELGGHSLLAIQLISRIRETFGRHIAVRHLFEQPTPAGLAEVVDEALRETQQPSLPKLSPVSRDMDLPLSFAQRRLWLLDQLEGNINLYNLPGGLRFRGPLNIAAIAQALAEVIRRHEALRTTFVTRNGQPRQVIADANPVFLPIVDLSSVNQSERVAVVKKLGVEEARRPFDLSRDPLLRVCLFRLSDDDHVGLFTIHHIVSDAWSMNLLLNELTTLYTAFSRGETSPLPELKIQYPDFAVWQQTHLAETLSEQLNYWKQQLADAPARLNLPIDRPRATVPSYRGAQEVLLLSPEITAGVNELCRSENVTQFMVLLSSFKLLLSWYAGQDDIVVGAPIAGRNQVETEALVGFFVNTLVLRTKLNGNPDFREVLRRVRETSLGAYAHQDVPFEMLVETLTPERSLAYSPLFQVVVGLQNIPVTAETNGELAFEEFFRNVETTHYDLELTMIQAQQGLITTLTYNVDLFEPATIRRMLNLWQRLLAYLFAHADAGLTIIFEHLNELDQQERLSAQLEFKETALQQLKKVKRRVVTHVR
jgi:amino acid adenylation domain-containing protein